MTDESRPGRGGSEREIAAALRLCPDPPRVVRLSRRVLIGLGVVAGLGIGAALILALQGRGGPDTPRELYSTDRNPTADGLATLPRDYTGVPRLGPPLPGDLGRPIVLAVRSSPFSCHVVVLRGMGCWGPEPILHINDPLAWRRSPSRMPRRNRRSS